MCSTRWSNSAVSAFSSRGKAVAVGLGRAQRAREHQEQARADRAEQQGQDDDQDRERRHLQHARLHAELGDQGQLAGGDGQRHRAEVLRPLAPRHDQVDRHHGGQLEREQEVPEQRHDEQVLRPGQHQRQRQDDPLQRDDVLDDARAQAGEAEEELDREGEQDAQNEHSMNSLTSLLHGMSGDDEPSDITTQPRQSQPR